MLVVVLPYVEPDAARETVSRQIKEASHSVMSTASETTCIAHIQALLILAYAEVIEGNLRRAMSLLGMTTSQRTCWTSIASVPMATTTEAPTTRLTQRILTGVATRKNGESCGMCRSSADFAQLCSDEVKAVEYPHQQSDSLRLQASDIIIARWERHFCSVTIR